ncbi:hypothetical protein [Vibrio bathopelagicus]|uniref:hypothetical protein n=1 Tax=Vibrio bathopelagicus TaxID=2777577 RepID=UPI001863C42E|nr:hypothetical protein [Vibrio bathopelagicus]
MTKKRARYIGELFCACWLDNAPNLLADIKKPAHEQAFAILACCLLLVACCFLLESLADWKALLVES